MSYYQRPTRFDKRNPFNEKNWITADPTTTANNTTTPNNNTSNSSNLPNNPTPPHSTLTPLSTVTPRTQWIDQADSPKPQRQQAETRMTVGDSALSKGVGNKSAVELMQDILKGVREGDVRAYYSKEAEETLSELLTNKYKLTNYIKKLEGEMVGLDTEVVKNYEVLVLLLQQVGSADVEVKQGEEGMEIRFNRSVIQRQEAEIEKLEREKEEREKQIKYIIEEYESIIFNFNDVIEKLVSKEDARKQKF